MPFGTLSVQMLWKLFYLMHQVESGNLDKLSTALLPAECKKHLQGTAVPAAPSGTLHKRSCNFPAKAAHFPEEKAEVPE